MLSAEARVTEEPGAGKPHAGICAGGAAASLPRLGVVTIWREADMDEGKKELRRVVVRNLQRKREPQLMGPWIFIALAILIGYLLYLLFFG